MLRSALARGFFFPMILVITPEFRELSNVMSEYPKLFVCPNFQADSIKAELKAVLYPTISQHLGY